MEFNFDIDKEIDRVAFETLDQQLVIRKEDAVKIATMAKFNGILFQLNIEYIATADEKIYRAIQSVETELMKMLGIKKSSFIGRKLEVTGAGKLAPVLVDEEEPKIFRSDAGHRVSQAYHEATSSMTPNNVDKKPKWGEEAEVGRRSRSGEKDTASSKNG
jgi:hypothetical protein